MQPPEYKPRSVRELLTEMKDTSDLMVDLAYAALLYESSELADLVHQLESKMDELMYTIRIMAAVAARNVREAHKITGILQVASSAEAISNAAGDIADLIKMKIGIHPVIKDALKAADEKICKLKISPGSSLDSKSLRDLRLPSSIGVWVMAIKRKNEWMAPIAKDAQLLAEDELVVKGPPYGMRIIHEMAGTPMGPLTIETKLKKLRKELSKMRDLSDIAVDLAYSSLMLGSTEVAEEVREIEEAFNRFNYQAWLDTLKIAARERRNIAELNSVLQLARYMESITDAADSIVDIVIRKIELHPVFAKALSESLEKICRVKISPNSRFVNKTLEKLNLWGTVGVYVLVIKRDGKHIITPGGNVKLRANDIVLVRGSFEGIEKFQKEACAICELSGAMK
ncbi:MAG: potassium channel family protein [Candidatus Hadarchaeum sp.]|uniref:potassium channel family protein n=1 Tax=Candidatus Hadarchaeum sp. TaxID=2883567 RepID=UPI003D14328D